MEYKGGGMGFIIRVSKNDDTTVVMKRGVFEQDIMITFDKY